MCTKNNKRINHGFTLVELIVVLVILAILAALLLPTLTGYIDKTRETKAIAEARQVALAATAGYADFYVNREGIPANPPEARKRYIADYAMDLMSSECGMGYSPSLAVRSPRGNLFSVEDSPMDKNGTQYIINNIKKGELGGNCARIYVKPVTFDSLVAVVYFSKDKKYCITVMLDPASTTSYKDVAPGTYIVQKIE